MARILRWRPAALRFVPLRWERYGHVILVKIPPELRRRERALARAYARHLGIDTVVADAGGIEGELRIPRHRLVLGRSTETVHLENGVRFVLDPLRIMFSSGNLPERIRFAGIPKAGETLVDLCAGAGAFSLPPAVHVPGCRVIACEKNPQAASLLRKSVALNHLGRRVEVRIGDCRDVAPAGVADRVVIGYIGGSAAFLPAAFRALRPAGGCLHFHEAYPIAELPSAPLGEVMDAALDVGRPVLHSTVLTVKSFGPRRRHVVTDCTIGPASSQR